MYFVRGFVLALHIFGVIFWMGGLLMITSLLARVPDIAQAEHAYQRAIGLEADPAVRRFLQQRRDALTAH